ncbi:MAG: PTS sugar transporter subunit IIB [Collinsella sp.]
MSIIAARIDNRLLHGIVATQWVPEFRPQRLMVIDDIVANDPTKKAAMRMAKPSGVALSIINKETALANYRAGKYDDHTVFIVARDPQTILDVIQTGQVVPTLVVRHSLSRRGVRRRPGEQSRLRHQRRAARISSDCWHRLRYHRSLCAGRQARRALQHHHALARE